MSISCAEKSRGSVCGAKGSDRENMLREGDVRMADDYGGIGNVGTPSDNRMPRDVRITCNESSARDVRRRTDLSVVGDVSITLYEAAPLTWARPDTMAEPRICAESLTNAASVTCAAPVTRQL